MLYLRLIAAGLVIFSCANTEVIRSSSQLHQSFMKFKLTSDKYVVTGTGLLAGFNHYPNRINDTVHWEWPASKVLSYTENLPTLGL